MSAPEISINVGELDAGGKELHFTLRAGWIRGVLEDHEATAEGEDGSLDIRASRSGNDVVIHGTLKAELIVPCARCLEPAHVRVDEPVSLLYVPRSTLPKVAAPPADKSPATAKKKREDPDERILTAEDADTFPYDGEHIVLDDVVRDELILETPIFPLCSEDCPGMRPPPDTKAAADAAAQARARSSSEKGGSDKPDIDPRLLPLLRLRTQRK
jgi:uncharacterized protein